MQDHTERREPPVPEPSKPRHPMEHAEQDWCFRILDQVWIINSVLRGLVQLSTGATFCHKPKREKSRTCAAPDAPLHRSKL